MRITVKAIDNKYWGLQHESGWIKDQYGESPVVSENKSHIEFLSENINKKKQTEKGFALDEPYATLYYSLYWLKSVRAGKDPMCGDSEWEISCDPLFHLNPGPPLIKIQFAAYSPVIEWLNEIGSEHIDLPLLYAKNSEELEDLKNDKAYRIGVKNSNAILTQWNNLSNNEKALTYYLQYHISRFRHSFCASILFLNGKISVSQFVEICCAAEGISPKMGDVSEEEYNEEINHFSNVANQAKIVLNMLNE